VATDVSAESTSPIPVAERATDKEQTERTRPPAQPHRRRFIFVYAILALALGAAITGIVVFAGRAISPAPAWSTWKPSGGGLGAAKQIAQRVSVGYHLPNGDQLVDVIPRPPSFASGSNRVPVPLIAIRGPKGRVDEVQEITPSDSIWYSLCGLGQSCSIASGKPSVARATLVRREILELALYTFKYVGGVKSVVAFMPPPAGSQPQTVVYLRKNDLEAQLKAPLTATLAPKVPLPSTISAREQEKIDTATESRLYKFGLSQTQQGDAVLVLTQLSA
jgi:hypothetical protein